MAEYPKRPTVSRAVQRQHRALGREQRRTRRVVPGKPVGNLPYQQFTGQCTITDPGGVDDVHVTSIVEWLDAEAMPLDEWELMDWSDTFEVDGQIAADPVADALGGPGTGLVPPYGAPGRYAAHVDVEGDVGDWAYGGNGIIMTVPTGIGGLVRRCTKTVLGSSAEVAGVVIAEDVPFAVALTMRFYGDLGGDPVTPRPEWDFHYDVFAILTQLALLDDYNVPIGGF